MCSLKVFLPSLTFLAAHILISAGMAASTMKNLDTVSVVSCLEKDAYKPYYIDEATTRALATAMGTTTGMTVDPSRPIALAKIGPNAPIAAFVTATFNNVNALTPSILRPLKLTMAVDNLMGSVFSYTAILGGMKFSGASTNTLKSGDSSYTEYTLTGGALVSTLFLKSGTATSNIAILTSAEKLAIFLRAVFGINGDTFQTLTSSVEDTTAFPGCFGASWSDQLDSGTVLTVIFDTVLGRISTSTTIAKFPGEGVFNRINASAGGTTIGFGGKTAITTTDLKSPAAYFKFVLGTDSTDPKYDIARLRALLQDLVGS